MTMTHRATGSVRAGGEGHLDAHGLGTPFDATAGRPELVGVEIVCWLESIVRPGAPTATR